MAASASRGVDEPEDLAERLLERLGERVVRLRAAIVCLLFESRWGDATNCSFAFGYRGLPPVLPERCPSAARALRRQQKTPLSRRFEAGWQDLLVARRLMIAGGLAGSLLLLPLVGFACFNRVAQLRPFAFMTTIKLIGNSLDTHLVLRFIWCPK